ncbi:MAG TPA: hypothetical protein VNZ58_07715 [Thermomicrobiales bacterium]|nr:hypothetical protein [Thermomicrobiales bacterium]
MNARWSRRHATRLLAATGLSLVSGRSVFAGQTGSIESGGIGMTAADWEAVFGPGEAGQSYMIYTYPAFSAKMHVGSDVGIIDYFYIPLENSQYAEGMDPELARTMTLSLLPHDARLRQTFQRNESPGSIVGVTTEIWTSLSLGQMLDGRRTILVRSVVAPPNVTTLVEIDVEKG